MENIMTRQVELRITMVGKECCDLSLEEAAEWCRSKMESVFNPEFGSVKVEIRQTQEKIETPEEFTKNNLR